MHSVRTDVFRYKLSHVWARAGRENGLNCPAPKEYDSDGQNVRVPASLNTKKTPTSKLGNLSFLVQTLSLLDETWQGKLA